jgi:transcriptional regulator with XRE-family HTH domain
MTFGEKLQTLRKQNGLSQEQLASQLTISSVNAEFKCLKTDGVQCPQTAGENGKLFGLTIFIKSTLH